VRIVPSVFRAIVEVFKDEVIACPTTPEEWRPLAEGFRTKWNEPHACGALDGKHIQIKKPANSGTYFHNYKGFFSVVLLALVDSDYKFVSLDVAGNGVHSDAQLYNQSELYRALEDKSIGFPAPEPMPNDDTPFPYFILGDDAFALRDYLLKPYGVRGLSHSQRIYNYRISRGHRVVENAFGILANRWQILLSTMMQSPPVVRSIVECIVCLHNLL
jgi:hypothetical protein